MKTPRATGPLAPQDGLYTVLTKGTDGTSARVIGALRETLFAGAGAAALVRRIADPRVAVVTLDRHREGLLPRSGERRARLHAPGHRARRRASGRAGVRRRRAGRGARCAARAPAPARSTSSAATICRTTGAWSKASCDAFARAPRSGARRLDRPRTSRFRARWSIASCRRQPTRTSPRSTRRLGVRDAAPVVAEPYNQWVIEDRFAARAPALGGCRRADRCRRRAVRDDEAAPAERQPLDARVPGFPVGPRDDLRRRRATRCSRRLIERPDDARRSCRRLPRRPASISPRYCARSSCARFRNPALPHRTRQIAMDGSQKLPQRLLGTIRDSLGGGDARSPISRSRSPGWMRYASGTDEKGATDRRGRSAGGAIRERSPRRSAAIRGRSRDGLLELGRVFGDDLPRDAAFRRSRRSQTLESLVPRRRRARTVRRCTCAHHRS